MDLWMAEKVGRTISRSELVILTGKVVFRRQRQKEPLL